MTNTIKHQSMRIAGKKVDAEKNIDVYYPYTNEIIGINTLEQLQSASND